MFMAQLNTLTVISVEECETQSHREYVRVTTKSQSADRKNYTPTYILMVWNKETIEKAKKLEIGDKIDAYCKCTIFLNKKNDAQDISYTLLDFEQSFSEFKTTVDRTVNLRNVVITKLQKDVRKDKEGKDVDYYKINGFSEQDNLLCNFNINAFNEYVVKRIEDMKIKEKSCINCCAKISPFERVRNGKVYQDYSYVLLDLEFAEHKKKENEEVKEEKPYSPTEKEWNLKDFDIFKRKFTEKL